MYAQNNTLILSLTTAELQNLSDGGCIPFKVLQVHDGHWHLDFTDVVNLYLRGKVVDCILLDPNTKEVKVVTTKASISHRVINIVRKYLPTYALHTITAMEGMPDAEYSVYLEITFKEVYSK